LKTRSDTEQAQGVSSISLVTLWAALVVRKDEELDAGDAASTLFRLFRSKHVRDLKLIFHVAFIVLGICVLIAACWFIWGVVTLCLDPMPSPQGLTRLTLPRTLRVHRPRLRFLVRSSRSAAR
jgi:hypothetical protein